jgi:hypothetical protein
MEEPGIDEHLWRSRWEGIEEDLRDSPAEALAEADDLVEEMMVARGLPLDEPDGESTAEPETVRQFLEARRVRDVIDSGEPYDPGDVANAVDSYRSLYDYLLNLGPTSGEPV